MQRNLKALLCLHEKRLVTGELPFSRCIPCTDRHEGESSVREYNLCTPFCVGRSDTSEGLWLLALSPVLSRPALREFGIIALLGKARRKPSALAVGCGDAGNHQIGSK